MENDRFKDNLLIGGLCLLVASSILVPLFLFLNMQLPVHPELPQAVRVGESPAHYFYRFHDDSQRVTCWTFGANAISCLPDSR